jgi:hypothetical protein
MWYGKEKKRNGLYKMKIEIKLVTIFKYLKKSRP